VVLGLAEILSQIADQSIPKSRDLILAEVVIRLEAWIQKENDDFCSLNVTGKGTGTKPR
jgi:hypothetical protein